MTLKLMSYDCPIYDLLCLDVVCISYRNTVEQMCPSFLSLAPAMVLNLVISIYGIKEDPSRQPYSKHDYFLTSDCYDINIWKPCI